MRRLSVFVLCAAFHALAFSAGCGGDEKPVPDAGPEVPPPVPDAGPPDAGPKPDAGPVDLLPPTVLSYTPEKNATGVPPESLVEVTFSEAMQADRGTLQLTPGTGLPNNGVLVARPENWDFTRHTVRFSFPQGLPLRKTLTVNVANFADVAGNPMQGIVTFSFTVSDGVAPAVSSSYPEEGASSVPLSTSEITLNFNQPMDTTVGTLVPGGGLSLGAYSWVGNQSLKAPITSPLVNNGTYSVRLDNFRNANVKALDGALYLGDSKLDFGTGPDLIRPTVREASPREGATEVQYDSTRFVVVTFSEPMDTTAGVGKAELVDNGTRTVLAPTWSGDGFTVSYDVQFKLPPSATLKVALSGFKDRAGNPFDPAPYLGDGVLDFSMAADTVKPYVSSSSVQDGTTDIYPVEVYATGGTPPTGWRKVFTFGFNEPMKDSVTRVTLVEVENPASSRTFFGEWSADRRSLKVTITPDVPGQLPLTAFTRYYLDVTALQDAAGNPLDPFLGVLGGNGRLEFSTLPDDPLLDHACEHALTLTVAPVLATVSASSSPRTDTSHAHYEVSLPSNGSSYEGFTRMQIPWMTHVFYLNRNVGVSVSDPVNPDTAIRVTRPPVAPACPSVISYQAEFTNPVDATVNVKFGPFPEAKFRFVYEKHY